MPQAVGLGRVSNGVMTYQSDRGSFSKYMKKELKPQVQVVTQDIPVIVDVPVSVPDFMKQRSHELRIKKEQEQRRQARRQRYEDYDHFPVVCRKIYDFFFGA